MFNLGKELKIKVEKFLQGFCLTKDVAYAGGISLETSSDCGNGCQGSCYGCSGSCTGGCRDKCAIGYKNNN